TRLPAWSRRRVETPSIGRPTQPGRRSPSWRVLIVMIVSLIPYRSIGAEPVRASMRSKTGTGRGALPETRSRADDSARADDSSATTRDHTVGTPKYSEPPAAA